MTYRAVIFDLDGTLLDTLADIAESANAVLAELGQPTHPADAYRLFVGEGVRRLFAKALGPDEADDELIERCVAGFNRVYAQQCNVHTRPYDGVDKLLWELGKRNLRLAVLSNKPHHFTRLSVEQHFREQTFSAVYGEGADVPRKPDPAGANKIVADWGLTPSEILYVGDTSTDMQTAQAAGLRAIGAAWGFRSREELQQAGAQAIIERPLDLLAIVDGKSVA